MTGREELRVRAALEGISFPADRYDAIAFATDRGDVEPDVLDALEALPTRAFTSTEDVVVSIRAHA